MEVHDQVVLLVALRHLRVQVLHDEQPLLQRVVDDDHLQQVQTDHEVHDE